MAKLSMPCDPVCGTARGAPSRGAPCELGKPPGGTGIGAGDLGRDWGLKVLCCSYMCAPSRGWWLLIGCVGHISVD